MAGEYLFKEARIYCDTEFCNPYNKSWSQHTAHKLKFSIKEYT